MTKLNYPLAPEEYRYALKRVGLTPEQAGWLLSGSSFRTGRRYYKQGAPFHVALILAMMEHQGLDAIDIEALGARWRPLPESEPDRGRAGDWRSKPRQPKDPDDIRLEPDL